MKADATKIPTSDTATDQELEEILTGEDEGQGGNGRAAEKKGAEFLQSLLDYRKQVRKARGQVRDAKTEYDDLREEARRSKKSWEAAVEHLGEIIDEEPEHLPLFDGVKKGAAGMEGNGEAGEADGESGESWRSTTVEELGLPTGLCDSLRQNPETSIETLGDLVTWQERHGDHHSPLTLIPKVGQGKAEKIADACEAFWAGRQT